MLKFRAIKLLERNHCQRFNFSGSIKSGGGKFREREIGQVNVNCIFNVLSDKLGRTLLQEKGLKYSLKLMNNHLGKGRD
jgi:5-methylthioribose kinase